MELGNLNKRSIRARKFHEEIRTKIFITSELRNNEYYDYLRLSALNIDLSWYLHHSCKKILSLISHGVLFRGQVPCIFIHKNKITMEPVICVNFSSTLNIKEVNKYIKNHGHTHILKRLLSQNKTILETDIIYTQDGDEIDTFNQNSNFYLLSNKSSERKISYLVRLFLDHNIDMHSIIINI